MSLKPSLFLSHAAKDGDSISLLKNRLITLTGRSIDIFVSSDGQSIPFGRNWVHEVEEALKRAKLMYVFLSPAALESKWVLFESGYAYSRGISVVPVGILGVDLGTIGPPLGLLQGFNISSGSGMNNLIKIINDVFELSFPEILGQEDYQTIFSIDQARSDSLFGKYSQLVHEIVFPLQCVHSAESGVIQQHLESKGVSYFLDGSNLYAMGISFPLHKGATEIRVDPLLSSVNFGLLESLIPVMEGENFKGRFFFRIRLPSPVRSVDQIHRLSAKIFGTEFTLAKNGEVAIDTLYLKLQQQHKVIGVSETGPMGMASKLARSFIQHTEPDGVQIEASYADSRLSEAPLARALGTFFQVGALFLE